MHEFPSSMVGTSTIDARISFVNGGHLHHRCMNFLRRWWTPPPSMHEFPSSMVDASTIDVRISFIDGERRHHRCTNFLRRWWMPTPSMYEFPSSMVDASTIDARISFIDGGRLRAATWRSADEHPDRPQLLPQQGAHPGAGFARNSACHPEPQRPPLGRRASRRRIP
jgi:hypothetical protein